MRSLVIILAAALLGGCCTMPDSLRAGVEHVSHPLVGWPFSPRSDEDGLTELRFSAVWRSGCGYASIGGGMNLRGKNGGGFYGPALTGSFGFGCEWDLK